MNYFKAIFWIKAINKIPIDNGIPNIAIPAIPKPQINWFSLGKTNINNMNKIIDRTYTEVKHNKVNCQNFSFIQPDNDHMPYLNWK